MECLGKSQKGNDGDTSHLETGLLVAERISKVLDTAKALFGGKGYAATTMDDIAGASGMSKKTIYKLFENKAELFRAMLTRNLQRLDFVSAGDAPTDPVDDLRRALCHIADVVFRPEEIALHRLLIAERKQSPALTIIFTEVIFDSGTNGVVACLERIRIRKELAALPLRSVADMMIGSVFSKEHFRSMIDDAYSVDPMLQSLRIDAAINLFCATPE